MRMRMRMLDSVLFVYNTYYPAQYFLYQILYLQFNFMVFDLSTYTYTTQHNQYKMCAFNTTKTKTFMLGVVCNVCGYLHCINAKEYHETSWRHEDFHATKVNGKYLSRRLVMIFLFFSLSTHLNGTIYTHNKI